MTDVVERFDDLLQAHNLQNLLQSGRRVKQLQFSAAILQRHPVTHQTSDSLAINGGDAATVQEQVSMSLIGEALERVSKLRNIVDYQSFTQLE